MTGTVRVIVRLGRSRPRLTRRKSISSAGRTYARRRTSGGRSVSGCARQIDKTRRRTRVSSDRSRDRKPSSCQPASRRSSVPREVRRSVSASGWSPSDLISTSGSGATRMGDCASRFRNHREHVHRDRRRHQARPVIVHARRNRIAEHDGIATPSAVVAQATSPSSGRLPTVTEMSKQGKQLTGSTGRSGSA